MIYLIDGSEVTKKQALNHYIISNPSSDILELKLIFTKACTIDGESQREILLSDAIEIIVS